MTVEGLRVLLGVLGKAGGRGLWDARQQGHRASDFSGLSARAGD
ncbi:hypothetical protein ACWENO_19900 [Streptomyces sp. NPDC004436]